jgi:hypothetical protein
VNTQSIGKSNDTWAQFMKLTQEARSRNQGIAAVPAKQTMNRVNASRAPGQAFPQQYISSVNKSQFISGEPAVKAKIVGGLVDTYA